MIVLPQAKRNLVDMLVNNVNCGPTNLSVERNNNLFKLSIINSAGDELAEVCKFELNDGNTVKIFDVDAAFNFTLSR